MDLKIFFASFCFPIILLSCNNHEEEVLAYGNFETEDVIISSEVTGEIISLDIEEGSSIRKGESLGLIDSTQLAYKRLQLIASTRAINSGLVEIDAQIQVNEVNMDNLDREFKRLQNLQKEKAVTPKQIDDMQGQISLQKAQISALQAKKSGIYAQIAANKAQIQQIEDQIRKYRILSPMDGTVLEVYMRKGELALPGKSICKIANLDRMILRAFISGDQVSSVNLGDTVRLGFDNLGGGLNESSGTIIWISPKAEFTPKIIQTREERVNLVYAMKVLAKNNKGIKIGMPGEILMDEPK